MTTRANATGIAQSDLGLASFDADDFTVTDGWVTLKDGGVDYADLPDMAQNTVLGRTTAGSGDVSSLAIDDLLMHTVNLQRLVLHLNIIKNRNRW